MHDYLGTTLGQEYGLARKATAIAVRVLGDGGSGTYELVSCVSAVLFESLTIKKMHAYTITEQGSHCRH